VIEARGPVQAEVFSLLPSGEVAWKVGVLLAGLDPESEASFENLHERMLSGLDEGDVSAVYIIARCKISIARALSLVASTLRLFVAM
jgi:hypothetical protein